jgi:hypothetical protein
MIGRLGQLTFHCCPLKHDLIEDLSCQTIRNSPELTKEVQKGGRYEQLTFISSHPNHKNQYGVQARMETEMR